MQSRSEKGESAASAAAAGKEWALVLGALGVVYGDIGTSPLYALRECFLHGLPADRPNVLGALSLIIWSLIALVSVKYLAFVMRADNRGEGGILAMMTLVTRVVKAEGRGYRVLVGTGILGACLLYADAMITPAITVLSAVEGLNVATSVFQPYIVPLSLCILVGLFACQHHGTARIGAVFGPVMLLWFLTIGLVGIRAIATMPSVLHAFDPTHGVRFLASSQWRGFTILGSVFLAVTGAEVLYADMGHFGRGPIRTGWFYLVFPCLVLSYLGQGAYLLRHAGLPENLFYQTAPGWALYPLVLLATMASVIASQAVISGAFSLSRQATQLGYSPRLQILQTSEAVIGQIYVPGVNWLLLLATFVLVLWFRHSSNLAAAYGVAVSTAMLVTTVLLYRVAWRVWGWQRWSAGLMAGAFLILDVAFFVANIVKIRSGGWLPLLVAATIYGLMVTWKEGRARLARSFRSQALPVELFLADVAQRQPLRVPGLAVFLSGNPIGVPRTLLHNLKHNTRFARFEADSG
jgi:KUP system potassium uptake protein